jgi:hypothetical protein
MDGVVSPATAIEIGQLGGLGVLNLEGIQSRYEDPDAELRRIAEYPPEKATHGLQDIYRAQNLERIVETGRCDCETRFPSWEAAEAEFRERYASDARWKMLQASDGYNRRANTARPAAQAICEATGNW